MPGKYSPVLSMKVPCALIKEKAFQFVWNFKGFSCWLHKRELSKAKPKPFNVCVFVIYFNKKNPQNFYLQFIFIHKPKHYAHLSSSEHFDKVLVKHTLSPKVYCEQQKYQGTEKNYFSNKKMLYNPSLFSSSCRNLNNQQQILIWGIFLPNSNLLSTSSKGAKILNPVFPTMCSIPADHKRKHVSFEISLT